MNTYTINELSKTEVGLKMVKVIISKLRYRDFFGGILNRKKTISYILMRYKK
jgi:hypothetical protein